MTAPATEDRYAELCLRYDKLGLALSHMTDLDDFIAAIRVSPVLLTWLDPNAPGAVAALGRASTFQALADVAEEVLRLKEEATDGNPT